MAAIPRRSTRVRRIAVVVLLTVAVVYLALGLFIWRAMHQPPEQFGRVMAHLPAPVVFLLYPFETLWLHARAGGLQLGDTAPDFILEKVDKSGPVRLSQVLQQGPAVLVFGSYT